jgi:K+-sensing histidine kinase KdpD
MLKEDQEIYNAELIETIVALASQSIKRLKIYGELVKSKNQLEISNLSKEKYFSVLANDLEGTFKGIFNQIQFLEQNYSNIPFFELKKILSDFDNSLIKANYLLENIFEWSKIEMGKIEFKPTKITLSNLFELNRHFLLKEAAQKNIEIHYNFDDDAFVEVDERLIEIVIRNIVNNAIKFSYKGGTININSKAAGNHIEITIVDNGCGIEEQNLSKIFSKNIKFTTLGTAGEEGTGLGLLVAKTFLELHKSNLIISSKINKGTTVKFTLPKALNQTYH